MAYHTYTYRRRKIRWIHPDRIAHRNLPFEVSPWNELVTKHEFLADVRDDRTGQIMGIVARPDIYDEQYPDVYYSCLIERPSNEEGEIFIPAEWASDIDQEIFINKNPDGEVNTTPRRLICLSFNLYDPNEDERVERKLQQQRLGIQQTPWFLLFNLIRRTFRKGSKVETQMGSYYNIDFEIDGKNLVLDENVIPGRFKSWGSRFYELKTSDGEVVARIYRQPGLFGLSALHIVDEYRIEIDERYDGNKPLLYLLVALTDYLYMENRIRKRCPYKEGVTDIPSLSKLFRYD
ncbi:MAG: hypothetical protein QXY45_03905 [Candidatus Aenigmatarchaeota archaeon]